MVVEPYWNKKGRHERRGMYWGHRVENIKIFKIQMGSCSTGRGKKGEEERKTGGK